MRNPSMVKRQLWMTVAIVATCAVLGLGASFLVLQLEKQQGHGGVALFLARLVDGAAPGDVERTVATIENGSHEAFLRRLWILDEAGNVLHPKGRPFPLAWSTLPRPTTPYDHRIVSESLFSSRKETIVRLGGAEPRYLFVESARLKHLEWRTLGVGFAFLGAAVTCGTLLSLFVLFRGLKRKAELADEVISELQRGNLKARFPVTKLDEMGQAMVRFNRMADEIERLVDRLKEAERARMELIQDLAHDLRTPLASMKSLLETVVQRGETVTPEVREEFLELALQEVSYFTRLVEDFLFLARASEPRYRPTSGPVVIAELLGNELDKLGAVYAGRKRATLDVARDAAHATITGDPVLLRRAFRNVLDNAFSFARSMVAVTVKHAGRFLEVTVEDDGPGLSEEALKAFGVRRLTRLQGDLRGGRLGVGLGSVIAKTVASLHRGDIAIANRVDALGNRLGATIRILLPV